MESDLENSYLQPDGMEDDAMHQLHSHSSCLCFLYQASINNPAASGRGSEDAFEIATYAKPVVAAPIERPKGRSINSKLCKKRRNKW